MAFSCELRIIRAKNIELKSNESLFVRCYLSAGKNTKIKLNTHEISSKSNLFWNRTFSLECSGKKNSISYTLSQTSMVFELRKKITVPMFGKINKSILLGKGEVSWKSVFENKEMEIEKWISMSVKSGWVSEDVKPPVVQVAMKFVGVPAMAERRQRVAECGGRCGSSDYWDMFAIVEDCGAF